MIIKKELVVSNKKKAVIVKELRELKFRPFPKGGKQASSEGETEAALEEEEDQGSDNDYDYLLGMAIWSLTTEKVGLLPPSMSVGLTLLLQVNKLLAERDVKEQELIELLKLSPQDIWTHDLDNFLLEWQVCLRSRS